MNKTIQVERGKLDTRTAYGNLLPAELFHIYSSSADASVKLNDLVMGSKEGKTVRIAGVGTLCYRGAVTEFPSGTAYQPGDVCLYKGAVVTKSTLLGDTTFSDGDILLFIGHYARYQSDGADDDLSSATGWIRLSSGAGGDTSVIDGGIYSANSDGTASVSYTYGND